MPAHRKSRSALVAEMLHERVSRLSKQLTRTKLPPGMTHERLSTLSMIERHGPIAVTALAEKEGVRPPTMSRMVSTLVDEGFVRRREDKFDARGVLVSMTPRGRAAYRRAHKQRVDHLAQALHGLSQEQVALIRQLVDVLDELSERLESQSTR